MLIFNFFSILFFILIKIYIHHPIYLICIFPTHFNPIPWKIANVLEIKPIWQYFSMEIKTTHTVMTKKGRQKQISIDFIQSFRFTTLNCGEQLSFWHGRGAQNTDHFN